MEGGGGVTLGKDSESGFLCLRFWVQASCKNRPIGTNFVGYGAIERALVKTPFNS